MNNLSVTMVVTLYFGERRSGSDGYANFTTLIETLIYFKIDYINSIIFVINGEYDKNRVSNSLKKLSTTNINVKIFQRDNLGMSYAAWNYGILKAISEGDDCSHFFLLEDDYVPAMDNFHFPYLIKSENCAFVASLVGHNPREHAAISNGLLRSDVVKAVINQYGNLFILKADTDYLSAEFSQMHFLDLIYLICKDQVKLKFINDIVDICNIQFLDHKILKYYGNSDAKTPLMALGI